MTRQRAIEVLSILREDKYAVEMFADAELKEVFEFAKNYIRKAIPQEFLQDRVSMYNDWNEDAEPLIATLEKWQETEEL